LIRFASNDHGLLFPSPFGSSPSIPSPLEARHQKQIHNFNRPIIQPNADRPPRRRHREQFRVIHGQLPTIRQVNIKWVKRASLMHPAKLLDAHD
jgi:hypothetical protein